MRHCSKFKRIIETIPVVALNILVVPKEDSKEDELKIMVITCTSTSVHSNESRKRSPV
jgi:hypothetical protein